jgi:hypothetical protein
MLVGPGKVMFGGEVRAVGVRPRLILGGLLVFCLIQTQCQLRYVLRCISLIETLNCFMDFKSHRVSF